MIKVLILACFIAVSVGSYAGNSIVVTDNVVVVYSGDEKDLIHEFILNPVSSHKEVRLFISFEPQNNADFEVISDVTLRAVFEMQNADNIFTDHRDFKIFEGVSIPLQAHSISVRLFARNMPKSQWKLKIFANYRNKSIRHNELTEENVAFFNDRLNELYNPTKSLYEFTDIEYEEFKRSIFPFDHIFELEEMLDANCIIQEKTNGSIYEFNAKEFSRKLGRDQFSWGFSLENISDPIFDIQKDHAYIYAKKRLTVRSTKGIKHYEWDSKIRVEIKNNQLVATKILRTHT